MYSFERGDDLPKQWIEDYESGRNPDLRWTVEDHYARMADKARQEANTRLIQDQAAHEFLSIF